MPEELVRVQHGEPIKMSSLKTTRFYLFLDSINYLLLTAECGEREALTATKSSASSGRSSEIEEMQKLSFQRLRLVKR